MPWVGSSIEPQVRAVSLRADQLLALRHLAALDDLPLDDLIRSAVDLYLSKRGQR